jgi:ribosomal protein S18 acetylase RimI-like enzyme
VGQPRRHADRDLTGAASILKIRSFEPADEAAVVDLWRRCGLLVNPLNDPAYDIRFCRDSGHGDVLVLADGLDIAGAVMVGHDGHRGFMYYLGVDPNRQETGLGRQLVAAVEGWWQDKGVLKGELMVRHTNTRVIGFYQRCGYMVEQTALLSKRVDGIAVPAGGQMNDQPVVITYLEMNERPNLPYMPPPRKNLALLGAPGITVPFYRYLYDAVGRPWYWTDRKALSDAELDDLLRDGAVSVHVLYVEGAPAGFFELDARQPGVIDLAYFGIMPEFIGARMGPWLLTQAIDMAWDREPERVTVNTCTLDHPKALPLYQRLGFHPYDRKEVPPPWLRHNPGLED